MTAGRARRVQSGDRAHSSLAQRDPIGSDATMRARLIIACAGIAFAADAQAQEALKLCRQIKDDADRLKCYDGINTSSPSATGAPAESKPGTDGAWEVRVGKSPLDDSPQFSAMLPSSDGKSQLLMHCRERKTEVAVSVRGFIKCGTGIRVIYRVDQGQSVETPWNAASSCYMAIAPSPIEFIRALGDQGKVFFRLFDQYGAPFEALFNLGKVSEIRSRLAEACGWDGAPAPKAPSPATSPNPPKASPK